MRKALVSAICLSAASLALASDLGGDGLGGPTLQPRANSAQLGEPGLSNRETAQVDPVLIEAGEPALDFRFAENKWMRDSVSNKQSLITFSRSAAQSPGTYVGADGLIHDAAVNLALYSEQFDNAVFSKVNSSVSANQATAPDGKQTADKIQATGSPAYVSQALTLSSSKVYTISAYLKSDSANTWVRLGHDSSGSDAAWFDLQNGTIGTVNDDANQANIENVGDGWYRCSIVIASGKGSAAANFVGLSSSDGGTSGTGSESVFVWGFQIEETDPATMAPTAYIHTTSQALAAPRFDHVSTTGNVTTNLLTFSEMLDNAAWLTLGSCGVTANAETAPDGTATAETITINTLSDGKRQITSLPATVGSQITASVWLKAGTATNAQLWILASGGGLGSKKENVTLTSEWQRFTVTSDVLSSAGDTWRLRIYNNGETGTFYAWGAQLEASPTPGPYVRTLSETRSISDANAESLGLLVEEARANAVTESEFRNGYAAVASVANGLLTDTDFQGLFHNSGVEFDGDGATTSYVYMAGGTASTTNTLSVFVRMEDGGPPNFGSSSAGSSLNDFSLVLGGGLTNPTSYTVEHYGNDLYRISTSRTFGTSNISNTGVLKYGSNSLRGFTVSGYQIENNASFATSYIPTTGSSQTRYADVAAVQDEDFSTTNLISYSESFDVGWSTSRLRPVVSNVVVAPDGQTTADYIEQEAGQTNAGGVWKPETRTGLHNLSVYAKKKEKGFLRLTFAGAQSWIDLNDCSVGTTSASTIGVHAEDVGDGWCRVSATYNFPGTSTVTGFYVADTDGSSTVTDSGGIYLWGASLTQTEYPVAYTTTRNLLTDSQDFERSSWVKANASIGNDVAQAPDGTLTADRIVETGTASHFVRANISIPINGTATSSIYVKKDRWDYAVMQVLGTTPSTCYFELADGGQVTAGCNASVQSVGNGWFRFQMTATATTITTFQIGAAISMTSNFYAGDGTSGMYLWGAQLEPGTTATDYVRTVDVVGKAYGFYEPTEGTVFVEAQAAKQDFGGQLWFNKDQTSNRGWSVVSSSTTAQNVYYRADDNSLKNLSLGSVTENSVNKMVSAIDADDVLGAINGGTVQSAALTAYYVFNQLRIGHQYTAGDNKTLNGHIKRLTYWPTRQSDSTLQVITE